MKLSKERKTDRILTIAPIEGKDTLSSTGLIDTRLFTGENKLHVVQDPKSLLWDFHYEAGVVPPSLKDKFTSFSLALNKATNYFKGRNCQITGIID